MREATKGEKLTAQIMEDLHQNWTPHPAQVRAGKPLIDGSSLLSFCQNGRKWGKTDFAIYMLWRWALMNPGATCYYIAPELQHGRELIWNNQRLVGFGRDKDKMGRIVPGGEDHLKKYIKSVHSTDSRITLKNNSTIKVVGSENWGAANGLTPDFAVYDEFKVFKTQWHTEFNPNRIVRKAPLLIIGTPPKPGDHNKDQYIDVSEQAKTRDDMFHMESSSYENPYVPKEMIDNEIEILRQRGELDVIEREYYGKLVYGGEASIFPMLDKERHFYPHAELVREIKRDLRKLDWFCITDPGTTTCFAAMIGCINPFNKQIYILDEIYETDQQQTSVRSMYPRLDAKMSEFYPMGEVDEDWYKGYDEAAAWFATEVMQQYGVYFLPTQKHLNKKEHGLSLIKDILLHDLVKISDRCEKLFWEMRNYVKDDKGNIPKKNDHLIDCLRYLLAADNYSMIEVMERKKQDNDMKRRAYSLKEDYDDWKPDQDWTSNFTKDWNLGD